MKRSTPASEVMEPAFNPKSSYKGTGPVSATFAQGGEVITSKSRFMKAQDVFRTNIERNDYGKDSKGGELAKTEGETKVEKAIKPRK